MINVNETTVGGGRLGTCRALYAGWNRADIAARGTSPAEFIPGRIFIDFRPGTPAHEIAASTANHTHTDHNGHALAYGIQNLVGIGGASGFEISGLRYSWFAPNTLLANINNNRLGWSSGGIAHPVTDTRPPLGYPWNIWSPTLFARYDGFELMSGALQTNFSPSSDPMQKWREEIVARLNATFAGNGFPSARTGSDWADVLSQFTSIPFVTHIGLSQWWGDMTQLSQANVDAALRAGRTVASRLGGLAILRLRDAQGVSQEIGSRFTMPVDATVSGEITLRAARTGLYRVRVIENSSTNIGVNTNKHDSWHTVSSGHSIVIPFNFTFAGGQRAYHVVVEGQDREGQGVVLDTIYTSPIFIRSP